MEKIYVSVSKKRYDELIEMEKAFNKNVTTVYHETSIGVAGCWFNNVDVFNASDGIKLLSDKIKELKTTIGKKKWYQFVELKE